MVKFEQYSGVLFDLHGVIADSSQYHLQAWHQLADELGIAWSSTLNETLLGMDRPEAVVTILKAGHRLDQYSEEERRKLGEHKNQMYLELISHMSPVDVLPGIIDFLDELKAQHYGVVLASASVNAPLEIKKMQLENYFPLIVDPATLSHNKPDPEIYQRAAEMLKLPSDKCIGIEDSKTGLTAVNRSGALSVGVGETAEIASATVKFHSTNELTLAGIREQIDRH
ncbi:beta-phosphoglucomutase [Lactobacillus sp. LC28-10]|uniref:Beta-phosphoglucomutase n=1 Tax=Secundilactobacillus angelensis TaxID=2722706 RepID=A0ABX1KZ82_9LACO|nr:beta-phosphoglucomutase [Secundilactobacillus angelensis]MCH5462405.1 beta-phosphoglucomutase [Secundilactobacillus angelensis]NLR18113.1 beta-phosphoglucomutase [Secundilactobacillus angelensis]